MLLAASVAAALFAARAWASKHTDAPAEHESYAPARMGDGVTVQAAGRGAPHVSLSDGRELVTAYEGDTAAAHALAGGQARPRSLASADFDEDGVADLAAGYAVEGGGAVSLLRGNVDSVYPNSPEAKRRRAEGALTEAPFLSPARVSALPAPADFLAAGDFDADGHFDVVAATKGGATLLLLPGDGHGGFAEARAVGLPGPATALTAGDLNRRDGLADVVVGVEGEAGARVLVFEGPNGALRSAPEGFDIPAAATSFAVGFIDDHYAADLAVAAGRELLIVAGRDRKLSLDGRQRAPVEPAIVKRHRFDSALRSITVGNFGGDDRTDIALLAEDGVVRLLTRAGERRTEARGETAAGRWRREVLPGGHGPGASLLLAARVSSRRHDDLLLTDSASRQLRVLGRDADGREGEEASAAETSLDADGAPVAVLPMRLDPDALGDPVILTAGRTRPAVSFTAPRPDETPSHRHSIVDDTAPSAGAFSNTSPITINAGSSGPTASSPYPSTITVSGQPAGVNRVRVKLNGITQSFAQSVDILLVGPGGQKVMVLSDYFAHLNGQVLTFDDGAASVITAPACCVASGTYKPTDINDGAEALAPPAPAGPYGSALSAFNGTDPNGVWSLYVSNESIGSGGSIGGGWTLILDEPPPVTFVVTNTADSGAGSLRQAILDANSNPGADIIGFNIPGPGVRTIALSSPLPVILDPVTIDATTQPGFAGKPLVEVNGAAAVFQIEGGRTTVRGFVINGYDGAGVLIRTNGNNIIEGNFIGTNAAGTSSAASFPGRGVEIDTANNVVGGTTAAARNLIAGASYGVFFSTFNAEPAENNVVQGNYIGTNDAGTNVIGSSHACVTTRSAPGSPNNVIGGTTAGARNVISGCGQGVDLVYSGSQGTLVQGNFIGTNAAGTAKMPVTFGANDLGVWLSGSVRSTTIGGTTPAARNVISGSTFHGVQISEQSTTDNLVQGNFLGTDVNGAAAVGNGHTGVFLLFSAAGNTIGGAVAGARNVISGNGGGSSFTGGIQIGQVDRDVTTSNVIQGNYVGTDATGQATLANRGEGVAVPANADGNRVENNRIAFNTGNGVRITDASGANTPGIRISITDNEIYSNNSLGIDLGGAGTTPNDAGDTDGGPNLLQNFPALTSAAPAAAAAAKGLGGASATTVQVTGTLNSAPNTLFTVHWYFTNSQQCVRNQLPAQPLLAGKLPAQTDSQGNAAISFPLTLPEGVTGGVVNATATDPQGNTSEFSSCLTVGAAQPGTLQFSAAAYNAGEGGGGATVTVTRAGSVSSAAAVDYRTEDADTFTVGCADAAGAQGAAYARCDFATAVGTLSFIAGQTSRTITVPLIDDAHVEGSQTFQLRLTNPAGGALGAVTLTTVTITDNDASGAPNPVNRTPHNFFVRQQYLDFLSREPDAGGFNAWLGVLNNCQPNAFTGPGVQSGCDRIFVSGEGFFRSPEFALKGAYAFRLYKAAFNRLPEYPEIIADMSFVAGATQAEVFQRRAELAARFTQRQEFTNTYGATTNAQYVAALLGRYQLTQITTPDPLNPDAGQKVTLTGNDLTSRLNGVGGALTRAQVLRAVVDSDQVSAAEFNNAFVAMQYYGYLRRKPEPAGYNAWLQVLQSGDVRTMVNGFLNSAEYQLRFGQP